MTNQAHFEMYPPKAMVAKPTSPRMILPVVQNPDKPVDEMPNTCRYIERKCKMNHRKKKPQETYIRTMQEKNDRY